MVQAPDNPSPPTLQSGAVGGTAFASTRATTLFQATTLHLFLRRYGDSLMSWFPQNPGFRLLAHQQLGNFKGPDISTDLFLRQK